MTKQQTPQQPDAPSAAAAPPVENVGRLVSLPWGKARVQEEVTVEGSASGSRKIHVGLMRLQGRDDGEELLRFFYRSDGRMIRGPLTLRESEIDELATALADAPEL